MATSDHAERRTEEADQTESGGGCPECAGEVRSDLDETVCVNCGLVLDDQPIDTGPEWRPFDDDERERTGAPLTPTRHNRGLSTEIGWGMDANGTPLSGRKRRQLGRLRREQNRGRWRSKAERNLAHGLSEVRRIVSGLGLPDTIRNQACELFRSAQQENLLLGRSIEAFAAASIYAVSRCNGLARTLDEIGEFARCDRSDVEKGYQALNLEFDLPARPPLPQDYIPRFASELEVPNQVRGRAIELAMSAEDAGLVNGCRPSGFAGACLVVAAREQDVRLTQKDAAEVAGVSPPTIRTHRDRLDELLD